MSLREAREVETGYYGGYLLVNKNVYHIISLALGPVQ